MDNQDLDLRKAALQHALDLRASSIDELIHSAERIEEYLRGIRRAPLDAPEASIVPPERTVELRNLLDDAVKFDKRGVARALLAQGSFIAALCPTDSWLARTMPNIAATRRRPLWEHIARTSLELFSLTAEELA